MASYDFSKLSVLVVDGHENMRLLLLTALKAFGVKAISQADNAASAIASIKNNLPNFVLSDLHMDGGNGIDLLKSIRLREDSPDPYLTVVIVSGDGDSRRVAEARDAGANGYMVKPITAKSLYTRIVRTIEERRGFVNAPNYFGPCRRRLDDGPPKGVSERRSLGVANYA